MSRPFTVSVITENTREELAARDKALRIDMERQEFINSWVAMTDRQDGTLDERIERATEYARDMVFTGEVKYPD